MALIDNLSSWWSLDEASGTRLDLHGSNDLSQTGTVSSTTGKVGNAAVTPHPSNYLSCSSNANLNVDGTGLTIAFWMYPNTNGGNFTQVLGKGFGSSFAPYAFWHLGNNTIQLYSFGVQLNISTLAPDSWYFVCGRISSAGSFSGSVNAGTPVSGSTSVSTGDTSTFSVGQQPFTFSTSSYAIDELGIWKRVLSDPEVTELYNGGAGLSYADLASPPATSKVPAMYHHLTQMGA